MTWTPADKLRAVIEQAPGFVALIEGPDLLCTKANDAIHALLGRPPLGRSARELFAGTPGLAVLEHVYATGEAATVTDAVPLVPSHEHGHRYFTRTFTPIKDDDGNVHAIFLSGSEVTADYVDRQASEAGEQRSRDELDAMFALFEEAPVMLSVLEPPDWTLTMANRGNRVLFGDRVRIGMRLRDIVSKDNATLAAVERVYATGHMETYDIVTSLEAFAGRAFTISVVPVRDRDGNVNKVISAAVEITEQVRAREELETQARDLELARKEAVAAARAKDQFLAMLSHELRNPLQPMLTAVQVMRLDGDSSPALDMLEREVTEMNRLVEDLLDISRIDRGLISLTLEPLEMQSVIDRGIELVSPLLQERTQHVVTHVERRGLAVSGDLQRLAQVVSNIIENAAKYSPTGAEIKVTAERVNDRVVLRVTDVGVGIAAEKLTEMFDAFVQGEQPIDRPIRGLGVGLTIAKSLVEAHHGTISARSDGPGRGSTIVVELPVNESPSQHSAATPLHILLVEDNVAAANTLQTALSRHGHHVVVAHDGPSALDLAAANPPQIALLDIGLPAMDGYKLGELLRAAHSIPVVAITAYGGSADRERTKRAGFAAHLVKPVDLRELDVLLETLSRN